MPKNNTLRVPALPAQKKILRLFFFLNKYRLSIKICMLSHPKVYISLVLTQHRNCCLLIFLLRWKLCLVGSTVLLLSQCCRGFSVLNTALMKH